MAKNQSTTKVTRITASDSTKSSTTSKARKSPKASTTKKSPTNALKKKRSFGILGRFGGYFKGAWKELRQVHWPTRKATWGLTGAVLLFSAFFILLITLLDAGFKYLFEQILK